MHLITAVDLSSEKKFFAKVFSVQWACIAVNMDHPHVIKNITGYNIVDDENVSATYSEFNTNLLIYTYVRL